VNAQGDVQEAATQPSGYLAAYVKSVTETSTITATGTAGAGHYELNVPNKAGITLPGTGGMGTTIFYIAGGILMVAAVVVLITRKRMRTQK
jgi:LPXTG-motif cell wall-anchored protein